MKLDKLKTAKIFNILKEGRFLNANSPKKEEALLFEYVENNYDLLQEYFSYIDIDLKLKQGYCYFASFANKEQKLNTILELIDIISFLYEIDIAFGVGYRFFYSEIFTTIKDDALLLKKLNKIKSINAENLESKINTLLSKLEKRGLICIQDEYKKEYVVLNSFDYMVEFFNKIEIKE
jgi:hypothetical protein